MKLKDLFERSPDQDEYGWHQEVQAKKAGKNWQVKDAKGKVIFHELEELQAKKAAFNKDFIKKYGVLKASQMT